MQKEQLSALMDGETLDQSLLSTLVQDAELQQQWQNYHLIRDTLRGDIGEVIHFDISARVAAVIAEEPAVKVTPLIPEAQPKPSRWMQRSFFGKSSWGAQLAQVSVAACVSMAVLVGVQHYNYSPTSDTEVNEAPAFNTLPMMGKASPVSLGVPNDIFERGGSSPSAQQENSRINAMLQDYELQRRLNNTDESPDVTSTATTSEHQYSGLLQP